jgi:formylglycine-generating enzyme required for sulfatase activity
MVGNASEWVADWDEAADGCTTWGGASSDLTCIGGAGASGPYGNIPGALYRGGHWQSGTEAGTLAVGADITPDDFFPVLGFRCAR